MNDCRPSPADEERRPPGRPRGVRNIAKEELDTFVQRLEAGDSVEAACEVISRAKPAIYARKKRDAAFAARWDDALASIDLRLEDFISCVEEGHTLTAAARVARISERQVYRRLREDEVFRDRVHVAQGPFQQRAERALIEQALGRAERPAEFDDERNEVKPYRPAQRGDPAQLRFLLRNRYPAEWSEARFKR